MPASEHPNHDYERTTHRYYPAVILCETSPRFHNTHKWWQSSTPDDDVAQVRLPSDRRLRRFAFGGPLDRCNPAPSRLRIR